VDFYERNGKRLCERDYKGTFTTKCSACQQPIHGGDRMFALGKDFHVQCFKCVQCKVLIDQGRFFQKNDQPYCSNCFLGNCAHCQMPINAEEYTETTAKVYHAKCFICKDCDEPVHGEKFYDNKNDPVCDYHKSPSKNVCATCKQSIKGESFEFKGKLYHPDHLVCTICTVELLPKNFTDAVIKIHTIDGKAVCRPCFNA